MKLDDLVSQIDPLTTVLFFGAGSAIPSGSPSAIQLHEKLRETFKIENSSLSLAEVAFLAEMRSDRKRVISTIRSMFGKPKPTGGLVNLPLYRWRAIYTTNYDELIEVSYTQRKEPLIVYTTGFDFSQQASPTDQRLYKIHGSINQDIVDGHRSRLIVSQKDYDQAEDFRESIYTRFAADLDGGSLVIVGYSLSDPDIKAVVDRALSIQAKLGKTVGGVFMLMYEHDNERAALIEGRGLQVAFGGIDNFFAAMATRSSEAPDTEVCQSLLDQYPKLRAITIDVNHSRTAVAPEFSKMFNGRSASYADIAGDYTFARDISDSIVRYIGKEGGIPLLLGASGVGKTTAARQVVLSLEKAGWNVWEHRADFELPIEEWVSAAKDLSVLGERATLLIDDAHLQIPRVNDLAERLASEDLENLRLFLVSTRRQWSPRYKGPTLSRELKEFKLSRLSSTEVDRLLALVERNEIIRPLVEASFGGYTLQERRRRLVERCSSDMFVCLRNIFATEKFDDIILREFSELEEDPREVYRIVAAMQNSGIRVHRQLIIRLLRLRADKTSHLLNSLDEIVTEYTISDRDGVYGWQVRHPVIAGIVTKYKFFDQKRLISLFSDVISVISPTYDVERQTIREICNVDTGIPSVGDKREQNKLLRQMISIAPGERVPRHRLIRNLIELCEFDIAETEMRLFDKDLGRDGPVARYQVNLLLARAKDTPGLLADDRLAILNKAKDMAVSYVERFQHNKMIHAAYCDVGLEWFKITGQLSVFDAAITAFKAAAKRLDDPEMTQMVQRYERRITNADLLDPIPNMN